MNETSPVISWPFIRFAFAIEPLLTLLSSVSGTKPTSLIGSSWIILAQRAPGCSKVPNSAVSVSRIPEKGAFKEVLSISFFATATEASAD